MLARGRARYDLDWGRRRMITEFRKGTSPKGYWYTFTYDNGIRATLSEYQGDLDELEALGRKLSKDKRREIRMRVHSGGRDRIHAIFKYRGLNFEHVLEGIGRKRTETPLGANEGPD